MYTFTFSVVEAGKFPLQQYCRCDGCCKNDTSEGGGVAVAEEGVLDPYLLKEVDG